MSEENYYNAVEHLADKLNNVKGVISVEPDQFGADVIVVLFDDLRYQNLDLPKVFESYEVCSVGVYALYDTYDKLVSGIVVNEPSIWDIEYKLPFKDSLDLLEKIIDDYEEKMDQSIDNSLHRIKTTLQWLIVNSPQTVETR